MGEFNKKTEQLLTLEGYFEGTQKGFPADLADDSADLAEGLLVKFFSVFDENFVI